MADSEAKWYILHTYSGYENKVAADIMKVVENRNLQHLIEDVAIPTIKTIETKENGTEVEKEEKIYPGYVFVKMVHTNEAWYICRNTRGVTGFVGPESKPTPLTEPEVIALERSLSTGAEESKPAFEIGDRVVVKQGVLENFEGVITEIDFAAKTVSVDLESIFGDITPTQLEIAAIRKI